MNKWQESLCYFQNDLPCLCATEIFNWATGNHKEMYGALEKAQGISHRLHGFPSVRSVTEVTLILFSLHIFAQHRGQVYALGLIHDFFQLHIARRGYSSALPSKESLRCSIVLWLLILHVDRGALTKQLMALGWIRLRGCLKIWGLTYLPQLLPSKTSSSCKIHFWGQFGSENLSVCFNSRADTSLRDYISILYFIKGRCVLSINPISLVD